MHSRREFMKTAGLGTMGLAAVAPDILAQIGPMKVTKVEAITFRDDIHIGGGSGGSDGAEFCWVRLTTDTGIVGYGETYPFYPAEVGALKDFARRLVGRDPRDIDGFWKSSYHQQAMRNSGGAEIRMLSALNMAQLDVFGKAANLPAYRLLGGRSRNRVKVYNTTTDYWAINETKMGPDTKKIVRFLMERDITAIKIYPFNARGDYITAAEVDRGMQWIRDIRDEAGDRMDICVDCWGRFDYMSALRIVNALEPYNILHLEDVMLMDSVDTYARLCAETSVPICVSETLATRYEYKEFLEAGACDVIMFDLSWVGGPTEGKKIADMADTRFIPVSPHTCGGPLLWFSSIHLCTAIPNLLIMESNYWKYTHQFPYFVENVPVPEGGHVVPPEAPGLGAVIREDLFRSGGDAMVEVVAEA